MSFLAWQACRNDAREVQKLYDVLLAARSGGPGDMGDEASAPALRRRILVSLAALLDGAARRLKDKAAPSGGGMPFHGALRREVNNPFW